MSMKSIRINSIFEVSSCKYRKYTKLKKKYGFLINIILYANDIITILIITEIKVTIKETTEY